MKSSVSNVSGPAEPDARVLHGITDQFVAILQDELKAKECRMDVSKVPKKL